MPLFSFKYPVLCFFLKKYTLCCNNVVIISNRVLKLSAVSEVNCNCNENMSQAFLFPNVKNPKLKKAELQQNKCNSGAFTFLYEANAAVDINEYGK